MHEGIDLVFTSLQPCGAMAVNIPNRKMCDCFAFQNLDLMKNKIPVLIL